MFGVPYSNPRELKTSVPVQFVWAAENNFNRPRVPSNKLLENVDFSSERTKGPSSPLLQPFPLALLSAANTREGAFKQSLEAHLF